MTDWNPMNTASLHRTVLLLCSDGEERIAKYSRGALWELEDDPGAYVLDVSRATKPAVSGAILAYGWK